MKLGTRIRRLAGLAVIRLIDDAKAYQRVQLDLGPRGQDGKSMQIRDDTPVMQHFGFSSHPPPGSDAAVMALGGDANQLVVIATGHRDYRISLPEGASVLFDMGGHFIKMIPGEGIVSSGNWTHTGDFTMTGDATVHGETLLDGDTTVQGETLLDGGLEVTGDALLDQDLGVLGDAGIDGALEVLGDITDRAASNTVTLFTLRFKYNAHAHTGVQMGGGTSGVTNQPAA